MQDEYDDEYEGQSAFREMFEKKVLEPMRANRICVISTSDPHYFQNNTDSHVRELWYIVNKTNDTLEQYVKRLDWREMSGIINKLVYDMIPNPENEEEMILSQDANFAIKYATMFAAVEKYEIVASPMFSEIYVEEVLAIIKEILRIFMDHTRSPETCEYTCFPKTLVEPSK